MPCTCSKSSCALLLLASLGASLLAEAGWTINQLLSLPQYEVEFTKLVAGNGG